MKIGSTELISLVLRKIHDYKSLQVLDLFLDANPKNVCFLPF